MIEASDPTRLAAQRLLDEIKEIYGPLNADDLSDHAADVRLVAEAVMEARSAKGAESCANSWAPDPGDDVVEEAGRAREFADRMRRKVAVGLPGTGAAWIDYLAGAVADLARRGAALQAEVVRLREALEGRTVHVVCEYGHEDSGTVQAIKGVFPDAEAAERERQRLGVNGHFVDDWPVAHTVGVPPGAALKEDA